MNKLLILAYLTSIGIAITLAGQFITNRVSDEQDQTGDFVQSILDAR